MDDIYWVWLTSLNKIGNVDVNRLLSIYKKPKNIYDLSEKELKSIKFLSTKNIKYLKNKSLRNAEDILGKCKKSGINILKIEDNEYPTLLRNIYNPPIILFVIGNIDLNSSVKIAITGSIKATNYGKRAAYDMAKQLANKKLTIVSGMALGAETYGHQGALDSHGINISVLGCGLDIVYPVENFELINKIVDKGCIISEYPPGTKPLPQNFIEQKRIISGISHGILIVEADIKNSSLITVDLALEQGKDVFVIPGSIYNKMSKGTNNLIKQGATLVDSVEDIVNQLKSFDL